MLCCAVLCCTVLYYAVLWYGMLCCAVLCYAMLCYAVLCYDILYYAILCYAVLYYAILCYAVLCYAVLCCAMLCYGCYAMLLNALLSPPLPSHITTFEKFVLVLVFISLVDEIPLMLISSHQFVSFPDSLSNLFTRFRILAETSSGILLSGTSLWKRG